MGATGPGRSPADEDRARAGLLVSIRPHYLEMILRGEKSVELRRTRPSVRPGSPVLFYASSPTRALIARARVTKIDCAPPHELWNRHGALTGIRRPEFDAYYEGADRAVGISFDDVQRLKRTLDLPMLRSRIDGFQAPMSWAYLDADALRVLLAAGG